MPYFNTGETKLYYDIQGSGDTLLFIHADIANNLR